MILKSRIFLVLAIAISLTGCNTISNSNGYETSVEIEPMPSDNKLNEYTALYTDVDYKYGKEILGSQSE